MHYAVGLPDAASVPGSAVLLPDGRGDHGFRAEYFKSQGVEGPPALFRVEDQISLGHARSPAPGITYDNFSVRWTGRLHRNKKTGKYQFNFTVDDGLRVFFDGKQVIDQWKDRPATPVLTPAWKPARAMSCASSIHQGDEDYHAQVRLAAARRVRLSRCDRGGEECRRSGGLVSTHAARAKAWIVPPWTCRMIRGP